MRKKSFFYFHLKNIATIIWLVDIFSLFLFCHYIVESFSLEDTFSRKTIESIADGVLLAACLGLISIIINTFKERRELENRKEAIENILKLSIMRLVYHDKAPSLEKISLSDLCEKALASVSKYNQDKFEQFRYAINNDLPVIEQNMNEATRIDLTNSLCYGVIISNLNALIKQWNDVEDRIRKYDKDFLINYSQNIYNIFFQSKYHMILYLKSCQKFSDCTFEDYAWSMLSEEERKLAIQGEDEEKNNITKYKNFDASLNEYKPLSPNMRMGHDNYIEIMQLGNNNDYSDYCFLKYDDFWNLSGIGFSANIFANKSMKYVSIVLFEKNKKDVIEFEFNSDGDVSISTSKDTLCNISKKESHYVINRYNKVSVKAIDDDSLHLFINGFSIWSISKNQIPFVLNNDTLICIGYERKQEKDDYHALIRINSYQKMK